MSASNFKVNIGPFAESEKAAEIFGSNLIYMNAISECVEQMQKIEKEHEQALLVDDSELAATKMVQLKSIQSSLTLSAHIFADVDEVSA